MRKLFSILMMVIAGVTAMAQSKTVTYTGTVIDAVDNEPLIGATVLPIGGGQGVATNEDGQFTLTVPASVKRVKVSYVGYMSETVALKNDMVVALSSTTGALDEVVVVAYGQQKKSSITGSVSQVNADKIAERPTSSVTSALEGSTSGIQISGTYGEAGSSPSIVIRGIGTVNGSTSPLYVIDGVPFGGNVTDLNPDDVESISVLKDAASAALYGNRAANGVIMITTKKAKDKGRIHVNFKATAGWYEKAIPEYDRLDIPEWMEAQFINYRNANKITDLDSFNWNDTEALVKANQDTNSSLISQWLYLNIFNAADTELFDQNGKFNRSLGIKGTYAEDLDWWDQAVRKGSRQEYTMNVMGATSKSDYRYSLGYLSEDGYMKDNSYDRLTAAANINVNPIEWLKTGLKLNVSHQKNYGTMNGVGDGNTSFNNAFYVCRYISPIYPVHLHDKATGDYLMDGDQLRFDPGYYSELTSNGTYQQENTRNQFVNRNVVWEQSVNKRRTIRNTINGTAYVDFVLPYGFVATLKGNLNTRNTDHFDYSSALIGDAVNEGALSKTLYTYKNYTFQQQLTWNHTYGERHHLNVLLAHENYSYKYDYTYINKRGQAFEGVTALSNFSELKSSSGYRSQQRTESYLGRVQYNFDDRYNVEASFRRDGTSRFSKDVRWGNFGSVGANWVFSNEEFLKNVWWLNSGKIYANWGQVGNDAAAGYYAYYKLMDQTIQADKPGYYLTQLAANDLKWETMESVGLGLEATMFDRWNLSIEYYNKVNKDLIFAVNLPASAGPTGTSVSHPTIDMNIGSIRNRGIEISTDVDVVRTKDFRLNVGTNFSFNQNRVTKLPDENKYLIGYNKDGSEIWENGYLSGSYKISEGHSRYQFYTYHWAGIDQMDGNSLYDANLQDFYITQDDGTIIGGIYQMDDGGNLVLDTNKSKELDPANYKEINGKYYVNNYSYAARKWSAEALPKINGSFSISASWKGLSVSTLFTYSLGGKIWDSNYQSLMSPGNSPEALSVDVLNSWSGVPAGMTPDSPDRITTAVNPIINYNQSYNNSGSDRWLISRNYLCFKNLNISYQLPRSILRTVRLSGVKVFVQGENLFLSTKRKGLSPQMGNNGAQGNYLVPARVFTCGLSLDI